ncbi:hypothetical protein F5984_20495 [Rudanella paleaurantiibacter]|uniref:Uncharacterized protein n=1 Tax=Rudanella paleaurantiibacter TaxID=2614655 RepID=A0A7J5TVE5_9BACT|nr:hypothetical protein [Rudanella paleaurantiibacter]KAB7728128.1 hypothetical protein F5984_20495 [Rudanella paleaurantiibacter]
MATYPDKNNTQMRRLLSGVAKLLARVENRSPRTMERFVEGLGPGDTITHSYNTSQFVWTAQPADSLLELRPLKVNGVNSLTTIEVGYPADGTRYTGLIKFTFLPEQQLPISSL